MRAFSLGCVLLGLLASSCSTLQPENVALDGAIWSVSKDDVRTAMSAARASAAKYRAARIYEVWVCGHSKILVYFTERLPGYVEWAEVERIAGRWRCTGGQIQITTA